VRPAPEAGVQTVEIRKGEPFNRVPARATRYQRIVYRADQDAFAVEYARFDAKPVASLQRRHGEAIRSRRKSGDRKKDD
jgi:hypothetical protein